MRRLLTAASALALALTVAGTAAAANGGFAPVTPRSPNAVDIDRAYYLILGVAIAVFLIVEVALVVFIIRFRSRGRPRTVEGPQITGNSRLELIWTVIPVLLLVAIASFVFVELPAIKDVPSARAAGPHLNIVVDGRQFYWRFTYPNGAVSIDRMVVPADRVVTLDVVSSDVIHSWWIPAFGGKIDAIPGRLEPHVVPGRPTRPLRGPVRRAVRDPARADEAGRGRRPARRLPAVGRRATRQARRWRAPRSVRRSSPASAPRATT